MVLSIIHYLIFFAIAITNSSDVELENTESLNEIIQLKELQNELAEIKQQSKQINSELNNLNKNLQSKLDRIIELEIKKTTPSTLELFGLTTPIVIPLLYFLYARWSEKQNILKRSSESLKREIRDNSDALTGKKQYQIVEYTTKDSKSQKDIQIKYTNAFLDFEVYDSIISSGELTRFGEKTQYYVTYIYTRIKNHNETINYTNEYEDRFFMDGEDKEKIKRWHDEVEKYEISLSKWEKEILGHIPKAVDALNKEGKSKIIQRFRF
ncbi:MAG: hypothetical protein IIC67_02015 [Thaumarchaeota archaeon]|nr:hypothetical protein [Nitrososphaerota archaeon]